MAKPDPVKDLNLDDAWRGFLAVGGVVLVLLGIFGWIFPPQKTTFAPQAANSKADSTKEVDDRSEVLSSLLIGVGALLVLVSANGRKIVSLKVGDQEAVFATTVAEAAGKKAKKKASAEGLSKAKQEEAAELARAKALVQFRQNPEAVELDAIANNAVEEVRP